MDTVNVFKIIFEFVVPGLVAIWGVIWGVYTYKDKKNAKQKEDAEKLRQEAEDRKREENKNLILDAIKQEIAPLYENNREQNAAIKQIQEEIKENELDRLRQEIINFANKLRNGFKMQHSDYQHIAHVYDKYHKRGGNSYIDSEADFIKRCKEQLDAIDD